MFVQIIQGHVRDPGQLKAAMDQWIRDLSPGAEGWINSTGGVTDDGEFIGLACFTDIHSAQRNSERPEQDQWWQRTSKLFDGEVQFHDADDAVAERPGDPNQAGFVQILQGQGSDRDRALTLLLGDSEEWAQFRPDVLGTTACSYGDGEYTMAVYFTDEPAARAGERKPLPPKLAEEAAELAKLQVHKTRYFDLHTPWIEEP
ncbi:hypothetical protein Ais01nite_44420 [Asanoa ishikariensis]|uniref:NIPSNAP protein n=1 Tax=Asanoa ishikariensis TaxID=137265 RepID=A0A1H3S842_9ACTN|nr:hypothetical protein [Asanoa ishikariensis]GIF66407.1 hypothetical protein Ais01nite_44420 [Asanoa ishikariensis]SDZ33721.1 hypothetical protein SAMN05421684_4641 [Asanoa ishikariensis]